MKRSPIQKAPLSLQIHGLGRGKEERARRRKVVSRSICVSAKNPNKETLNGRAWARNAGVCVRVEARLAWSGEGGAES